MRAQQLQRRLITLYAGREHWGNKYLSLLADGKSEAPEFQTVIAVIETYNLHIRGVKHALANLLAAFS